VCFRLLGLQTGEHAAELDGYGGEIAIAVVALAEDRVERRQNNGELFPKRRLA
jgi:hypothetical protein